MAKRQGSQPIPRRRAAKEAQAQPTIPIWVWFASGGFLAVLLVLGLFYLGNRGGATALSSSIDGLEIFPDQPRTHEGGDIAYPVDVPPGGPHNPNWQNCGIYNEPVRVENVVHSMEHGAVWIAYQPELLADQVNLLRDIVRQERRNQREPLIVLAPKPGLESPIILTAWRAQLKLDNASDERLGQFLDRFQRGPYTPEPGAPCTDGVGEPLS